MIPAVLYSIIISNSLLLIAFIYGMSSSKLRSNQQTRWYLIYLGFILGIELITKIFIIIIKSDNTQSIYPFYVAGEFYILVFLLSTALKITKKWHMRTLLVTGFIFIEGIVLWLVNGNASTGYGKLFSHLTIVCLVAYLLVKKIRELEKNDPFILVYSALFLYYIASVFLFLLMSQLNEISISIWIINNLLSSILYACSIYTFYILKRSY